MRLGGSAMSASTALGGNGVETGLSCFGELEIDAWLSVRRWGALHPPSCMWRVRAVP